MKNLRQANTDNFSGKAIFIFLIRFFPALANVLVLIYLSRNLSKEVYGQYQNYWVQLYVLSALAGMGLQSFLFTYSSGFINALLRTLSWRTYLGGLFWIVIWASVYAFLQSSVSQINIFIPFLFLLFYTFSIILEGLYFVFKRFVLLLFTNLVYATAFCYLHYLFIDGKLSLTGLFFVLLLLVSGKLFLQLLFLPATIKHNNLDILDRPLSEVRKLWLYLGVYDVSQYLFKFIDKFIISLVLAEELSAVYYNGSQDIPFMSLLLGAAGSAVLMQLASDKAKDGTYSVALIKKSSKFLSSIVFPLFFFFMVFRTELFSVLLSEKYLQAVPVFMMSILAIPLRAYNFTTILQNQHKGKIINIGAVSDLVIALALMYPLYQLLGLPGVALSYVISSYLQAGYYLYHTSNLTGTTVWQLLPFANWMKKAIVFGFVFIGFHYSVVSVLSPENVLIWGMALLALVIAVALAVEFKMHTYGNPHTQK